MGDSRNGREHFWPVSSLGFTEKISLGAPLGPLEEAFSMVLPSLALLSSYLKTKKGTSRQLGTHGHSAPRHLRSQSQEQTLNGLAAGFGAQILRGDLDIR